MTSALTRSHHLEPSLWLEGGSRGSHPDRAALGVAGRETGNERTPLALREGPDLLVLRNPQGNQQSAAAGATPAPLAHQKIADRHALRLPGALQDHVYDTGLLQRNPSLQLGPRK